MGAPRCIEQRALLTENRGIKLPSLSFLPPNYVFHYGATWAGEAERGELGVREVEGGWG